MQFESYRRETPHINLSALVDVLFILVIFIVLVANFSRVQDVDIHLPTAASQSAADKQALVVTIRNDGTVRVAHDEVGADQLTPRLVSMRTAHPSVLIVADSAVALQHAVAVLAAAQTAGFQAVSIATQERAR